LLKKEQTLVITWDLSDLYGGTDDPAIARDMADTDQLVESFVADYPPSIDNLKSSY
jgi:hypothetical protein